jgi:hypothetical protein
MIAQNRKKIFSFQSIHWWRHSISQEIVRIWHSSMDWSCSGIEGSIPPVIKIVNSEFLPRFGKRPKVTHWWQRKKSTITHRVVSKSRGYSLTEQSTVLLNTPMGGDELIFDLDEVGVSDWEDRKKTKLVVPASIHRETIRFGISRHLISPAQNHSPLGMAAGYEWVPTTARRDRTPESRARRRTSHPRDRGDSVNQRFHCPQHSVSLMSSPLIPRSTWKTHRSRFPGRDAENASPTRRSQDIRNLPWREAAMRALEGLARLDNRFW